MTKQCDILQPLDSYAVRASFDLVDLIALLANESDLRASGWSGRKLASQMSDRSFKLTMGDMFIDHEGARYLDLDVSGFDTVTKTMQVGCIFIKFIINIS
jgi:hypothetical protein